MSIAIMMHSSQLASRFSCHTAKQHMARLWCSKVGNSGSVSRQLQMLHHLEHARAKALPPTLMPITRMVRLLLPAPSAWQLLNGLLKGAQPARHHSRASPVSQQHDILAQALLQPTAQRLNPLSRWRRTTSTASRHSSGLTSSRLHLHRPCHCSSTAGRQLRCNRVKHLWW